MQLKPSLAIRCDRISWGPVSSASSNGAGPRFAARRTDIPSLNDKDAHEEKKQGDTGADPSVQHERCGLI